MSFRSPTHPIAVHFTIALVVTSFFCDLVGRLTGYREMSVVGWWTLALGLASSLLTIATGVMSRLRLDIGEGTARSYLRMHMALGPMLLGLLVVATAWRAVYWRAGEGVGWWYLLLLAATTALMTVQGYLGGELVYRWGAEVRGRHRGLRQSHAGEPAPRLTTGGGSGA